jgi:hypothetical protein
MVMNTTPKTTAMNNAAKTTKTSGPIEVPELPVS